ncbi:MAG: helix-hairpin-helix domain-containing protein [Burkholderiaceae bacterium]|jgi:competence protein ComEA|nr:helix-hairpin-helix domain-containing protein [Burkholderiaceae bacterium]
MFHSILKATIGLVACLATAWAMAGVDANKGSAAELAGVKGIGPVVSKVIVDERKAGKFKDWADFIKRVKGVGDARAAKLSAAGLTVNDKPLGK